MKLQDLKHVHIIGVGGTLMGAFAAYLKRRGLKVTGSDKAIYPPMSEVLANAQVEIFQVFTPENLTNSGSRPDLVVIGNVITRDNPEAKAAIEGGYEYTSLPEAMEKLFLPLTQNIVVSGTHGKTTTSSLLSFVLVKAGMDPSYFIGGVSPDLPNSFHVTSLESGHRFVLEGDEYDTAYWDKVPKFNHYLPDHVILSSIEYDHADIYPDLGAVIKAFEGLVARVRPGGHMIACYDYEHVRQVCSQAQVPVYSYGLKQGRFRAQAIQTIEGKASFEITDDGKLLGKLEMSLTGEHNVLNALSVFIECRQLGLSLEKIQSGLAGFRGVRRRQEERGEIGGVLVIDDFAHHPTAVRETLRGLKKKYPGRRVLTVFEPRSATSRRKVFQKDYVEALSEADLVYIASPYDQSKISQSDQFSSEQLVQDLHGLGKKAESFSKVESGVSSVVGQAQAGDLVAVLSNGGFDGFIAKLLIALKEWE